MIRLLVTASVCAAVTMSAQADTMRPAPDYFVDMVMATTTAQQLALSCPIFSFELLKASHASGAVISRLQEDGFDTNLLDEQMSGFEEALGARQETFLSKYGLDDPDEVKVCAAANAEFDAGTEIGGYLVKNASE
jgi:hypothetical protein